MMERGGINQRKGEGRLVQSTPETEHDGGVRLRCRAVGAEGVRGALCPDMLG